MFSSDARVRAQRPVRQSSKSTPSHHTLSTRTPSLVGLAAKASFSRRVATSCSSNSRRHVTTSLLQHKVEEKGVRVKSFALPSHPIPLLIAGATIIAGVGTALGDRVVPRCQSNARLAQQQVAPPLCGGLDKRKSRVQLLSLHSERLTSTDRYLKNL